MCVADDLCAELFRYIEQQQKCADSLEHLAQDLEQRRRAVTAAQFTGNAAAAIGSAVLIGAGIATFLTGGIAAPLLVTAASTAVGTGAVTSIGYTVFENWKAGNTMENAEKCAGKIESIWKEIERLQKKLTKECESQNPEDIQCEIAANILSSMAKRNGKNLSITRLYHLLKNYDMPINIFPKLNLGTRFLINVGALLGVLGLNLILKPAATTGAKYVPLVLATEQMAALSLKTVLKGTGQLAGGAFGLILTLPDLVKNCEDLIEHNDQTEASRFLRTKANEIRDAVKSIKKQLNELQEMINEIPETECHVDLSTEMCGFQKYTRGTIDMEYKQTPKKPGKLQSFILLSTKDMSEAENGSTRKNKSDDKTDKNKRQKRSQTSGSRRSEDQQSRTSSQRRSSQESNTRFQTPPLRLPSITMSNLRSLPNKRREITNMMENAEHFASDVMFFSETWLNNNLSSNVHNLDGFQSVRVDRDARLTGKRRGGGMLMLVNKDWATDVEVENIMITPDYELMVVSVIPHGHPQNAPPFVFIHVYVPGPNFRQAAAAIAGIYFDIVEMFGNAPVFLLGDFNRCNITPILENLQQVVTCPTRLSNILDMCFINFPWAYECLCGPPIGRSDHNVIHLIPKEKWDKNNPSKDWKCKHNHNQPKK